MSRNVRWLAAAVAVGCAFMFWLQFGQHIGSFENGVYTDETGRTYVARSGWMWGSLGLVAAILALVARDRS